jgi:hypothetical protein
MLLQKLILKFYWPLLRCIKLKDNGGLFTRNGEDVLILTVLFSHMIKNNGSKIIEINKPDEFPYSLATAFLATRLCSAVLINTHKKLALSYAKESKELANLLKTYELNNFDTFGCLSVYKDTSLIYGYSSSEQLLSSLQHEQETYSLVILTLDPESLDILEKLLNNSPIYSIMIINNSSGFFSIGDMKIREKLARKGFIFHTRLNGKDDFFILSDLINGFSAKLFELMNTSTLQRCVSNPPDSDYTMPR